MAVVIHASSAARVNALLADLASTSAVTRDAAVARLTVIGARAVERLAATAVDSQITPDTRLAALRALEGIGDPRSFEPAVAAIASAEPVIVRAGLAVLRRLLRGPRETVAIETLTSAALDPARPASARIAAAQALSGLGARALQPLWTRLESDMDPEVRRWAASRAKTRRRAQDHRETESATLETMLEKGLPDDPALVRAAVVAEAASAPLVVLRRTIESIRDREQAGAPRARTEWASARAAAHVALAERGSRIALYDLRESLAGATMPLPVEFLAAVTKTGDASCLEPLAAAYARSTRSGEEWWRQHLRHAFHSIVMRERITRRHAAMKKVLARWPAIVQPGT